MPPSSPRRPEVVILANPYSGSRGKRRVVGTLVRALRARGVGSRAYWDRAAHRAILRDPHLGDACRCLLVVGGDGTVGDVITERRDVAVAQLPAGNENLFARQYGFPASPRALARAVARGRTRPIDIGRAGDRFFTCMVSAGFDAEVVRRVVQWRHRGERLRGVSRLSYVLPAIRAACSYPYPALTLDTQKGDPERGFHAMAFNIPEYAARLGFAPEARDDDGELDWLLFRRPGRLPLLLYLAAVATGRHRGKTDPARGRAARVRIADAGRPVPLQVDGEAAGETPCTIEAVAAGARIIDTRPDPGGERVQ